MTKIKTNHKCDRCGREQQYREECDHCGRRVCKACIKNSKRASATRRAIICKDCWGDSVKRKKHKQA